MNAPIVAIRLSVAGGAPASRPAACSRTRRCLRTARLARDAVSGAAGTTGQGGTDTSGAAGISGSAGTFGAAGTMGAGGRSIRRGEAARAVNPARAVRQAAAAAPRADRARARAEPAPRARAEPAPRVRAGRGTATSGAGVTINGTFVPKEKAIAFIHFGHSNMRGQATKPTSLMSYFYYDAGGALELQGELHARRRSRPRPRGRMTLAGPGNGDPALGAGRAAGGQRRSDHLDRLRQGIGDHGRLPEDGRLLPDLHELGEAAEGQGHLRGDRGHAGHHRRRAPAEPPGPGFPARMAADHRDIRSDLGEPNLPVLFCDYEQRATGDSRADRLGRNGDAAARPHAARR